ncbi:ribonuclease H-like domain-containing protein, partial [Tanacetum coccineum]
ANALLEHILGKHTDDDAESSTSTPPTAEWRSRARLLPMRRAWNIALDGFLTKLFDKVYVIIVLGNFLDLKEMNVTSSSNLTQTDLMTLQGLLAKLGCNGSNNNAQPIANQFVPHPIRNNTPMALYSTPTSASVYGLPDDILSRYKAHHIANGSTQIEGIDVNKTFSPVVNPVKTIYMHQPPEFQDSAHPDYVLLLRDSSRMFLSQRKYATEILERAHMVGCNSSRTPVDTESKLGDDGDPVSDPTLYRSLAGSLQYLTFTRPDISYAVQQVGLYMHDPRDPHFSALNRILRYVRGTLDYGLQLYSSSVTSLVAYSDADWAGCPTTQRSTSGYCVFLGNNLLSWSSKRQPTLSRSSAEAEYRGVAETCCLRNLLCEVYTHLSSATLVNCDNVSVVYLSSNPVQHQRIKHIEIDIHCVRDLVVVGQFPVIHQPRQEMSTEMLLAKEKLIKAIRTCLKNNNQPPEEKSIAVLLAEKSILTVMQTLEEKQNDTESMQELLFQLSKDLQTLGNTSNQLKQEEQDSSQY